jgi:soluble lytic murein transglycosylase-like protein
MRGIRALDIPCTIFAFVIVLGATMTADAAIYVSHADGTVPRFSSHRIDDSFRLLIRDESSTYPNPAQTASRRDAAIELQRSQLDPLVERAAAHHDVDPDLVRAVIEIESRFDRRAVSSAGAAGVMQLMPETARRYRVVDRFDARQNIEAGVAYLRDLLDRFDGNVSLALAAYNAGEGAVDRHGRVIPRYRETMLYVPQVLEAYLRYRSAEAKSRR